MGFIGRIINKMVDEMAAACRFAPVDTLSHLSPDFLWFSYTELLLSNLVPGLNIGFGQWTITKMCAKVAAACGQFALVDLESFIAGCFQISYMVYFNQPLVQVRTLASSDNQDGCQNGRHLSVCTCGHSNLCSYLSLDFFQISYMNFFYQTFAQVWIWALVEEC